MNKSLRDEVEALVRDFADKADSATDNRNHDASLAYSDCSGLLALAISRHPPADGVVVPRDLFEAMRDDQTKYLGLKRLRGISDGSDALMSRIDQADAILAEGKA